MRSFTSVTLPAAHVHGEAALALDAGESVDRSTVLLRAARRS